HLATHRLNFGQGDFLMVGAYVTIGLMLLGVPALLVLVGVLIALGGLGWALERFTIRPLDRAGDRTGGYAWVLTTAGAALILQNVVELVWGKSAQYAPPIFSAARNNVVQIGGVGIFVEELA